MRLGLGTSPRGCHKAQKESDPGPQFDLHARKLNSFLKFLPQPNSKNDAGCVISSLGATPEIRRNYSGGRIVFNAIHAWMPP